jgi:two-component system OmpR family sensor kinase
VSLRSRLLVALGVVALVALVAADVATYSALKAFLLSRMDQTLQAAHVPIESALNGDNNHQGPGPVPGGPNFLQLAPDTFIEVRGPGGRVLAEDLDYERGGTSVSPKLPAHISGFSTSNNPGGEPTVYFNAGAVQPDGPSFRVRASVLSNGDELILAIPLSDVTGTLHRLLFIELAVTAGALLLSSLVGFWLVRLGLRPLVAIEQTAGEIAEGRLGHRVRGENSRTELGRLAGALNTMLDRIQSAFAARDATEARLRRFVADASHELRTPVAAVSAYAELFDRGASTNPEDLARVMRGIRGETARMGKLVEDLLLLARMDEGLTVEQRRVEVVGVAAEAVETATAVGPQWPVALHASEPVEVLGDHVRLRQVVDNLLANVRAHTPPGTPATVTVTREADRAIIEVADGGPGITAEQAERVFQRFYRADASRSRSRGGAGLGLAIVAGMVAAHGGTVSARPGPDGGALFTVSLPAAPDATAH